MRKVLLGALVLSALALAQGGPELYGRYCAACHQAQGQGIPGAFPPLKGLEAWAKSPEGRRYLAGVLLYGLQGSIRVAGVAYNGVMPPFGHLKDEEIAALLNHLVAWGGPNPKPFTPAEVKALRAKPLKAQELLKLRPNR